MTLGEADQNLADWSWFVDDEGEQQPVWTTLPKASQGSKELKHCSCKGLCVGTVIHAKITTFHVQIYANAKDNVKTRLIYGLCLMTFVIL